MDAAQTAAGHQIGDDQLTERLGLDPEAQADNVDVADYLAGVPVLAEESRRAAPDVWAWLRDVHRVLEEQGAPPIWATQMPGHARSTRRTAR